MCVPIDYLRELLEQYRLIDEELAETKKECDEIYSLMIHSPETESRRYREAYTHCAQLDKEKKMAAVCVCNILMRNVLFAGCEGVTNWESYGSNSCIE